MPSLNRIREMFREEKAGVKVKNQALVALKEREIKVGELEKFLQERETKIIKVEERLVEDKEKLDVDKKRFDHRKHELTQQEIQQDKIIEDRVQMELNEKSVGVAERLLFAANGSKPKESCER